MNTVTVYTKPRCVQCEATKRALDKAGIAYTTIDVTVDEAALAQLIDLGYMQAPVVMTETGHWSGYRPDQIKKIAVNA